MTEAAEAPPPEEQPAAPKPKRRRLLSFLPRPVWQIGRLLLLALVLEYLVVPQLAGPRKVLHLLTKASPLFLFLGVVLEALSLLAYGRLTRTVLPPSSRLPFFTIMRIELTTLAVSHSAPGGSAAGTALGYRLLTQFGASSNDAGFTLGAQGIGSAVVLNVFLWIALIASIPFFGFSPLYGLAAVVGALLLGSSAALVYAYTKRQLHVGDLLERAAAHVPFVDGAALRRSFTELAARVADLRRDRRLMTGAFWWAAANWLLDAASLEFMVRAFGPWANPDGLLVAYGLAYVLAVIPVTPGGLGVVEATLTTLLVGFGTTRGVATLGVVVYRLINFWAPIPVGGLAYLSLQVDRPGHRRRDRLQVWKLSVPLPHLRRRSALPLQAGDDRTAAGPLESSAE
jgi:uncharacterized protein (TIRG00374 family)